MINMKKVFVLICAVILLICGCGKENKFDVVKVNKSEAMEYIESGAILIDVRSAVEYENGHINGAINIDVEDILKINDLLEYENKNIDSSKAIIVYCRSGSRSANAANKLIELGYTKVYDLGSIDNWSD